MAGDFDIGPADYEADMSENGKGDTPRPMSVDTATFGKRWEETFRTCPGYGIGPCDRMGPNGSCAACGKGAETLGNPEE